MSPTLSMLFRSSAIAVLTLGATAATAFAEVSPRALPLGPINNSILTTWIVALLIILGVRILVRKPALVPTRGQSILESVLEGLKGLYEPIVGKKAMPMAFPLLICLFLFILLNNWSALLPGVGSVGLREFNAAGEEVGFIPFIRPFTADLNGTIALALISFGAWIIIVMRYAGPKVLIHDLFGNKADKRELAAPMFFGLSVIFLVVGIIETFSIFIRPVTLSVRLYGNIFGGENLLHATKFVFPFYFLELLVGLVQATVFTLLTAVYIGLICNHGDGHDHDDHGHGHEKEAAAH